MVKHLACESLKFIQAEINISRKNTWLNDFRVCVRVYVCISSSFTSFHSCIIIYIFVRFHYRSLFSISKKPFSSFDKYNMMLYHWINKFRNSVHTLDIYSVSALDYRLREISTIFSGEICGRERKIGSVACYITCNISTSIYRKVSDMPWSTCWEWAAPRLNALWKMKIHIYHVMDWEWVLTIVKLHISKWHTNQAEAQQIWTLSHVWKAFKSKQIGKHWQANKATSNSIQFGYIK